MGVNLTGLCSLPRSLGASGRLVRPPGFIEHQGSPSGSSGCSERRSTPSRQDLVVITHKYSGQVQEHTKTGSNKIQITTQPSLTCRS